MAQTRIGRRLGLGILAALVTVMPPSPGWAQGPKTASSPTVLTVEQPDAQRTRGELSNLLERYPPALRGTLELDPSLLSNPPYLAPYPALQSFLNTHPEIVRNPSYYVGENSHPRPPQDHRAQVMDIWKDVLSDMAVFAGFAMAIGVLVWLIRTIIDYRRWSRLARVQTDVHTKLLDRFTANNDLLAYIQSPAGSKFLESSPIKLDAGPRSVGAPLGRILWSVQGGLVLVAGGWGLQVVSWRADEASQPLHALGVLGLALGLGLLISAVISYIISERLGLIEPSPRGTRVEPASGAGFGDRK